MKCPEEIQQPGSPKITNHPGENPRLNPLARKLFLVSMGTAAAPVIIAAAIMLHARTGLSPKSSPALSAQRATARPIVPRVDVENAGAVAAKEKPTDGALVVVDGNSLTPQDSFSNLHLREHRVEIRLPGFGNFRILSDQPAGVNFGLVRLERQPSAGIIFGSDILLSATSTPMPPVSRAPDAVVNERDAAAHTAVAPTHPTRGGRVEIRGHAVVHHRHRPKKHAPPSMLAKIGRSVKEALTSVLAFPRTAKERLSWD
jgi:hypothetical protein